MILQRAWATLIGSASFVIGILRFIVPALGAAIPVTDGIIHIVTGALFLAGAWLAKGKYVAVTVLWLGFFYIVFGAVEVNLPHFIAGIISLAVSLVVKIRARPK